MLNKIITSLENLQEVKSNQVYGKQIIAEATKMYNDGWDKLDDGIVIQMQGNKVAIKKGNTVIMYEMKDFNIKSGILDGNIKSTIKIMEIAEDKKNGHLAQAIITKYYTLKIV